MSVKYMCPFECMSSSFSERIAWLRSNRKLSLQELGNAIGVSKTHIWEMETGASANPSLDIIRKLAVFFEVPCAALVETAETAAFRKRPAAPSMLNKGLRKLLHAGRTLKKRKDLTRS